MNILFLTLLDFDSINEKNIYTDLLRKFYQEGHGVYVISPMERKKHRKTTCLKIDIRQYVVKLKIGNIQKTNIIEKGISTVALEPAFILAIKKYYSNIKFDLILYSTPPITLQKAVNYVKKRDNAVTYLMLKDIFPQNAVDMRVLSRHGFKGFLYRYFRGKEIKLYKDSNYIGCMSEANVEYVKKHNPFIPFERIEVCPNCIEPVYKNIDKIQKMKYREKLGVSMDKVLFVYGGNLGRPQGIPFLVECLDKLKKNKEVYFLIVGDGTEYKILDDFVRKKKPDNVKLMKTLPKEEYDSLIFAADVGMIFLDYRFTIPNFPSRILAYMQARIPVLACTDIHTDIGKIIVNGGFGWWCKSNSSEQFSNMVKGIVKADLSLMGAKAYQYLQDNYNVINEYEIIMKHFR